MIKIESRKLMEQVPNIKILDGNYKSGRSKIISIPKFITIDEEFIDGVSLYIAEGAKQNHLLALTNTKLEIIKFYVYWLKKYFGVNVEELKTHIYSKNMKISNYFKSVVSTETGIKIENINTYLDKRAKNPNAKIIYYSAVLKHLFDSIIPIAKEATLKDKRLAEAYVRGILCGEGYCLRYTLEISMKDRSEIEYISQLLKFLKVKNTVFKRNNREEHVITILGRESLKRINELDGFKYHPERKLKLLNKLKSYKQSQVGKGERMSYYLIALYNLQYKNSFVTTLDISKATNRNLNTVQKNIRELLKLNKVRRFGGGNSKYGGKFFNYKVLGRGVNG